MKDPLLSRTAVNDIVRKHYFSHLRVRLVLLRQLLVERQWPRMKSECRKLARGARTHGMTELEFLAGALHEMIPGDEAFSQAISDECRAHLEKLMQWHDRMGNS